MSPIGSGLGKTLGLGLEGTFGTYQAPTVWYPWKKGGLKLKKTTVQSDAIHGGLVQLGQRRRMVRREAEGSITVDVVDQTMGPFLQWMMGSTPTSVELSDSISYCQVHTLGNPNGVGVTTQIGRPVATDAGTITPFSYPGGKVSEWTLSTAKAGSAELTVSIDALNELTSNSYVAPSYVPANMLAAPDVSLIIGGTIAAASGSLGAAGALTVSGGTTIPVSSKIEIKGTNGLDKDRLPLGSLVRNEQLAGAFWELGGTLELDFENLTDVYNAYNNDTPVSLVAEWIGPAFIPGGSFYPKLTAFMPMVYFDGDTPDSDGPAILQQSVPFKVMDGVTFPPMQLLYQSADTSVWV